MILFIITILSVLFAALFPLFYELPYYWILPCFIVGFVGFNVLYVFVTFIISLFLGTKTYPKKDSPFWRSYAMLLDEWIMNVLRIHIEVVGEELLPKEPIVLISNHRSNFDPMVALCALKGRRLAYISKESNLKLPVAGPLSRRCSFLPIDRENPRSALRTIKKASTLVTEQGLDLGIYPEGTRSYKGPPKPFKEGAFMLAKWAKAPLVIMATEGTEDISSLVVFKRSNVKLTILKVIPKEVVAELPVKDLMEQAQNELYEMLHVTCERPAEIDKVPGVTELDVESHVEQSK